MIKNNAMFTSINSKWATPSLFYNKLNRLWQFTLDPCADEDSHCCDKYYTEEDDGLSQPWANERVFMNPPYGRDIYPWLKKSYEEAMEHDALVVALIPARVGTVWYDDFVRGKALEISVRGRLTFGTNKYWSWVWEQETIKGKPNKLYGKIGYKTPAPFDSVLAIYHKDILITNNK